MSKYFRYTWNQILYEISWPNISMLSASIPSYESDADKKNKKAKPEASEVPPIRTAEELKDFFKF